MNAQKFTEYKRNFAVKINSLNPTGSKPALIIDAMKMETSSNSRHINLEITNTGGGALVLVLGTPIGIPTEAILAPKLVTAIGAICNLPANAASITDNTGAGATYITGLNHRFVRNAAFLNNFEVISANEAQLQNSLTQIEMPYNYESDSTLKRREYTPVFTEYNSVQIAGRGVMLSEFTGVAYTINAGVTIKLNLEIGAHDQDVLREIF